MPDLSICIPVKDRSRCVVTHGDLGDAEREAGYAVPRTCYWLPNCIRSIALAAMPTDDWEIVVVDFASTDWPLKEWASLMATPVPFVHYWSPQPFSAGLGLNEAGKHAASDNLLFLGADCLVTRQLILDGLGSLAKGVAYVPQPVLYKDPDHKWIEQGTAFSGTDFLTREMWERTGPFPEFRSPGLCDVVWFERARVALGDDHIHIAPHPGLFHQWHPHRKEWTCRHYPDWQKDDAMKREAWKAGRFKTDISWPPKEAEHA